jgi:hypothetical protein
MRSLRLYRPRLFIIIVLAAICVVSLTASARSQPGPNKKIKTGSCVHDDSGLALPAGFCATIFAEGIGHARHMVVSPSGVVYVNTWSGDYYDFDKPHDGGFLVALQDKAGAGKADVIERFGESVQTGGAGGVGIGMYKGSIYAEINDRIVRYSLPADAIVPKMDRSMWMLLPRLILAKQRTGSPTYRAIIRAPNLKLAVAYGVLTPRKQTKCFHPHIAMQRGFAMRKVLLSTPRVDYLLRNMGTINCIRIGRGCTNLNKKLRCRRKS